MSLGRIKFTLFLVGLAELFNKLIPLFVIRIGQTRLGLESLGHAQFAIYIVELFMPIMTWGFDIYGPVSLRQLTTGSSEWKSKVGKIMGARVILSFVAYTLLTVALFSVEKFAPYRLAVICLSVLMFLSGFTTTFIHTADQSLSILARITIAAKVLSLVAIAIFIYSPSDAILFAVLSYGVNLLIGLSSTFYIMRRYGFIRPDFSNILSTLAASFPFALTYILAILVERVELWFAESWGGSEAVGALSGPLKLYQGLLFAIMALSAVFYSEGLAFPEKIGRFLRLTVWLVAIIILPLSIGVFFIGEDLLVALTGDGFSGQGFNLALICTGMFGHSLLIIAGAQALSALGKVKWTNAAYLFTCVTGASLSMIFMQSFAPHWALLGPAIAKSVAGLGLLVVALRQTEGFATFRLPPEGILLGLLAMGAFLYFSDDLNWVIRLVAAVCIYSIALVGTSLTTIKKILRKELLS